MKYHHVCFTPSRNNEHNSFSGSSDMEDKDYVEQQFNAFSQHDEKRSQEKVMQKNRNGLTTNLRYKYHTSFKLHSVLFLTEILLQPKSSSPQECTVVANCNKATWPQITVQPGL